MPRGSRPVTGIDRAAGAVLSNAVASANITRLALSVQSGIASGHISALLNGKKSWRLSEVSSVCLVLGIPVGSILAAIAATADAMHIEATAITIRLPRPATGEHDGLEHDLLEVADHSPDEDALRDERGEW